MSRDKQIDSMTKDLCHTETCEIKKIGMPCNHRCKAHIYATRAIDKGYAKASEVAEEIFAELKLKAPFFCQNQIAYEHFYEELAELKKKYTAEMKKIKIGEWVYGKFDIPHCSECGYEPTEISPFCPMCNANMESEDTE